MIVSRNISNKTNKSLITGGGTAQTQDTPKSITTDTTIRNSYTSNAFSSAFESTINEAKTIDIFVAKGSQLAAYIKAENDEETITPAGWDFGNWRSKEKNNFADISSSIILVPETPKVTMSYSYSKGDGNGDATVGALGSMDTSFNQIEKWQKTAREGVSTAAALSGLFDGGKATAAPTYIKKFKNAKAWNDLTSTILDSITFHFNFGQGHLYSAEDEVVKPILALATLFAVKKTDSGRHSYSTDAMISENEFKTAVYASLKEMGKGFAEDIRNILTGGFELPSSVTDGWNEVGKVMDDIDDAFQKAHDVAALQSIQNINMFVLRYGSLVLTPMQVGTVTWVFDFSEVDEFGFPCSGSITFSKLSAFVVNSKGTILKSWGYKSNESATETRAHQIGS